jgi:3-oxoacyl-[acyl-carrier-protein] synthase II
MLAPEGPRPYDRSAQGMVPAAAGCVVVLESLNHAHRRGATVYGEVLGHAVTSDAHGMVGIDPSGAAWEECLRLALEDAGVRPRHVACVFGEGRGSPIVDRAELRALDAVFGEAGVRVAALSGQLGHATCTQAPLGAVAALEACRTGLVPDIAGLHTPIAEMGRLRWQGAVAVDRRVAVVTCCAPGGTYAALVVGAVGG